MKQFFILVVLVSVAFMGCNGTGGSTSSNDPINPEVKQPGAFSIQSTEGMNGKKQSVAAKRFDTAPSASPVFNLGSITATDTFYFILTNSGDFPITDVTITSDKDYVNVTPESISVIDMQGAGGIVPIIKVTVVHGRTVNGLSNTTRAPMGDQSVNITFNGKTTDATDAVIPITTSVVMNMTVLVANWDITNEWIKYDDTYQTVDSSSVIDFVLTNTGNVPLNISVSNYNTLEFESNNVVAVGDTLTIPHVQWAKHKLTITTDNTVVIADRAETMQTDGSTYFAVWMGSN